MTISTVGELRAALSQFPDSAPIQIGYAAGTASGEVEAVGNFTDAEFDGVQITIN
jgi:hypothetical protein